jgi:DNA replication protein DnaC
MGFNPLAYAKAESELKRRRNAALDDFERRRAEVLKKYPEISDIEGGIVGVWANAAREAFAKTPAEQKKMLAAIRKKIKEGNDLKEKLLEGAGYPKKYLDKKFSCKKCEDKGYIGGTERCECLLRLVKKYSIDELNKSANLPHCDRAHFSLDYYGKDEKGRDCKKIMAANLAAADKYIESFAVGGKSDSSGNLLLTGRTGLGKTHLSLAIGKALIEKGFIAMYVSAGNMLAAIDAERFGRADPGYEKALIDAELLIIDDLGAEGRIKNTKSEAYLYNVINTRINLSLPTIINTNISGQDEMLDLYTERVVSRILGCYKNLHFVGTDVRQQKKKA